MRRAVAAVAVLLVVLSSLGMAAPAAAQDDGFNAQNETVTSLQQLGPHPSGSPPSMRPVGDAGGYWLEYSPAGFMAPSGPSNTQVLEMGTQIRRNTVWLNHFAGWDSEDKEQTVHVVRWRVGTRQVQEGNQTVTERFVTDAVHQTTKVSLAGGTYDSAEVSLPPSYNEKSYVTMWIDGQREDTQWVFELKSSEAAESISVTTAGGLVSWATTNIGIWFVISAIANLFVGRYLLRELGTLVHIEDGSALEALVAVAFVGLIVMFAFWNSLVDTVVESPHLIGIAGGMLVGFIAAILHGREGRDVLLLQLLPDGETREDATGTMRFRSRDVRVFERDSDGKLIMPRPGWSAALARAWPGVKVTPELEFEPHEDRRLESVPEGAEEAEFPDEQGALDRIRTRLLGDSSDESSHDEIYLIDPLADDVVFHDEESWSIHTPTLLEMPEEPMTVFGREVPTVKWGKIGAGVALVVGAYTVTQLLVGHPQVSMTAAMVVVMAFFVRPTGGGTATAPLAPFAFDAAVSNLTQMIEGYTDAADASHFESKFREEQAMRRAESRRKSEEEQSDLFSTINEELAPDRADADGSPAKGVGDDD